MTSDIAQANLYPSETQKLIIDKIIDFNMFEDNYFKDVCIITKKEAKKNFPEFGQTGFYSWIESEKKNSLSIRIVQADENSDEENEEKDVPNYSYEKLPTEIDKNVNSDSGDS